MSDKIFLIFNFTCLLAFVFSTSAGATAANAEGFHYFNAPGDIVLTDRFSEMESGIFRSNDQWKNFRQSSSGAKIDSNPNILLNLTEKALSLNGSDSSDLFWLFAKSLQGPTCITLNLAFIADTAFPLTSFQLADNQGIDFLSLSIIPEKGGNVGVDPILRVNNGDKIPLQRFRPSKSAAFSKRDFNVWFSTIRIIIDPKANLAFLDQNLSAGLKESQKQHMRSYSFTHSSNEISGLHITAAKSKGEGRLYLFNLRIESGLKSKENLDELIFARRKKMDRARNHPSLSTNNILSATLNKSLIWETNPVAHTPNVKVLDYLKIIPHLRKLGINWIYFLPLWESSISPVGGCIGYPISDGYTFNPVFGTPDDFKKLVSELHHNNIKVMVDFCLHSASWSSPLLRDHPEWFIKIPGSYFYDGYESEKRVRFIYMYRLDFSWAEVQSFTTKVISHWVKEYNLDGVRLDLGQAMFTSKTLPIAYRIKWGSEFSAFDVLERIKESLLLINPDIIVLTESANRGMTLHGADIEYSGFWRLRKNLKMVSRGEMSFREITEVVRQKIPKEFPHTQVFLWGLETHDYEPADIKNDSNLKGGFGEQATKIYMSLISTLPGPIILFGGQELGNRFAFKEAIVGDGVPALTQREQRFLDFYESLFRLRKDLHLFEGHPTEIEDAHPSSPDVAAFFRNTSAGHFLVVINSSSEAQKVTFGVRSNLLGFAKQSWTISTGLTHKKILDLKSGIEVPAYEGIIIRLEE